MGNLFWKMWNYLAEPPIVYRDRFLLVREMGTKFTQEGGSFMSTYYGDMSKNRCLRVDIAHGADAANDVDDRYAFYTSVFEIRPQEQIMLLFHPCMTREEALDLIEVKNV